MDHVHGRGLYTGAASHGQGRVLWKFIRGNLLNERKMRNMPIMTESEIQSAVREVLKQSIVDPEFRKLAIQDGRGAISKVSTKTLPPDLDFRFMDNSGKVKTVILPDPVTGATDLSDAELEQVAGGCEINSATQGQGTLP